MSVSLHGTTAIEFKAKGRASTSQYTGVYPIIEINVTEDKHTPSNDINLFLTVEQLYELRTAITKAIRDSHNLKKQVVLR